MKLAVNISPCPNDTFMFDALINGRIDTRGFEFDVRFADIEELNRGVMSLGHVSTCLHGAFGGVVASGSPDISKISYAVLPEINDRYAVLDSGSALGHGNGPLLVARDAASIKDYLVAVRNAVAADMGKHLHETNIRPPRITVPGIHTTANLLLQRLFPELTDRKALLFSEIAPAVARGDFDAGVLIHEGRFTYREHGLELVADLGTEWERATATTITPGLPLPLGAIVASRTLTVDVRTAFEELLRESIGYAFAHPYSSREFVKSHAQEMDDDVIDSHIDLFVNEWSLSLGPIGRRAVRELTGVAI